MPGPAASDLVFSELANHNFSHKLSSLKRSTLSIHNRLASILSDSVFANLVAEFYERPLIANERCGSWYIDPKKKAGSAYFKSTDGHTGAWKLSLRRLNLHLLHIVGQQDGCIIVDSTRKGKRMPDALSKTIPIWCAVLNRLLFPQLSETHSLFTPPQVVSASEHAQIYSLLPAFLASLQSLNLDISELRSQLLKPLRPIWVTPESSLEGTSQTELFRDYHPMICCTVSRLNNGGDASEAGYIQGAADDTENWAHKLSPSVFWQYKEELLAMSEFELPGEIEMLLRRGDAHNEIDDEVRLIRPTKSLFVTKTNPMSSNQQPTDRGNCAIILGAEVTKLESWKITKGKMNIGLGPHKIGSKNLRQVLQPIVEFVSQELHQSSSFLQTRASKTALPRVSDKPVERIIIACSTGKDHAIGVALVILCLFFNNEGEISSVCIERSQLNKAFIRSRLGWLSMSMPNANPSRATLQSVNSFLLDPSY